MSQDAAPQLSLRIHRKKSMAILFRWRFLLPAFKKAKVFAEIDPEDVNFLAQLGGNVFLEFAFTANDCHDCVVIQFCSFAKCEKFQMT